MTFESMIEQNANTNNSSVEEGLAVKVSFGDEMRRASFAGGAYVVLHELVAKLFELDQAAFVLKYLDEDGDKITMSSDGEVKEALQLAKDKKLLRLFLELKGAPKVAEPTATHHGPHHGFQHYPFGPHRGHSFRGGFGGFGGRGGFGGFGGRGGFAHGHFGPASFSPMATPCSPAGTSPFPVPQAGDPNANYHSPHVFAHGSFSPVDGTSYPKDGNGPYAARCAFKEHKHAMKEQMKLMKMNATTTEDREAVKDYKEQMKAECKAKWLALKEEKKEAKKKMCDDKWEKKREKCDEKWDKKREKCDKYNRPFAKHVAHITIPDNSELPANTPVTKTWRLRNEGNIAWPVDSHLVFISRKGDNLNGPEQVFVGSVEPQQEVDVSVTFVTPSEPGRYIGYYRMAHDGAKFGQRVWVSFIVPTTNPAPVAQVEAPSAPPATPVPAPTVAPLAGVVDDVTMD